MRGLSAEEWSFVSEHPGKVWRHRKDLVCTVPLPPRTEHVAVTRARLEEGVADAFSGSDTAMIGRLLEQTATGELLVIETDLLGREYGVVLST